MLKSKKLRIALGTLATLILVGVIGGFALSRGYLIHFLVDDTTISHDQFYDLVERVEQGEAIRLYCAQGEPTLGWLYVYESHCFSTQAAVDAYMKQHYGA